ncbi:MAG: M24 family metallopeptidase [Ilumatobacteraceae bacterium]
MHAPALDYSARLDRVQSFRDGLGSSDGSAILLTRFEDIRWLAGFTGSNGWLVVSRDGLRLLTDGRYTDQAAAQAAVAGVDLEVCTTGTGQGLAGLLTDVLGDTRSLWFQANDLTVAAFDDLRTSCPAELRPLGREWDALRRRKDAGELHLISTACDIADAALAACRHLLAAEVTERDLRDELEYTMRRLGADGPSYETIVASGPDNAARPHHRPTAALIEPGHTVVIDVGALVQGYHSDMTRSFVVGDMTAEQNEIYEAVKRAQQCGVDAVAPGVPVRDVDLACRKVLQEAGLERLFTHGTGHGVGLAIHEEPFLNSVSAAVLEVGEVVTVEPGVYRGGFGGFRVEDLVVVTETGCRRLTNSPKDPTCLPSPPTT